MAVNTTPLSSNLLVLVANDDASGNLTRKYADLRTDAADQDVFDVGDAIARSDAVRRGEEPGRPESQGNAQTQDPGGLVAFAAGA